MMSAPMAFVPKLPETYSHFWEGLVWSGLSVRQMPPPAAAT